ncbi:MAG TPA: HEAT repeat domain-containing protein [Kofleriaceae bacterium]|jgi:HEAT repeat protein
MKRSRLIALAVALSVGIGGGALADISSQSVLFALTPIDSTPSTQQLNAVHDNSPAQALTNLESIARNPGDDGPGVQIRAIRALASYCTAPCATHEAHTTVIDLMTKGVDDGGYSDAASGAPLLVLRSTIETIGLMRVAADYTLLAHYLSNGSRDIRVAAAFALRDLGNTDAIDDLRARFQVEANEEVKSAISDALRVLGQPTP